MQTIQSIVDSKLCHGCGFCAVALAKDKIEMVFSPKHGHFIPKILTPLTDLEQHKAVSVCPAINLDYKRVMKRYATHFHENIGEYEKLYTGYSTDVSIHKASASGGVATEILLYLLENKMVDGAIVTVMDEHNPLVAKQIIARTREEIISAQQSKYGPVNAGRVIELLEQNEGTFAITLQPCHIQALRVMMKDDKKLRSRLPYIIGIFCSRAPKTHGVEYILEKEGYDPKDVDKINFRNGDHHLGHMSIYLKDGTEVKVKHLSFDYWGYMFINFFTPARCYMCPDKLSALADISVGDNWTAHLEHENGSSMMIVRNKKFIDIVRQMETKGKIVTHEIADSNAIIWAQDIKTKTNIAPRKFWWKVFGNKVPDFGSVKLTTPPKYQFIKALPHALRIQMFNYKTNHRIITLAARISKVLDKLLNIDKYAKFLLDKAIKAKYDTTNFIKAFLPAKKELIEKTKKYKIILIGGYGTLDIGDEAMPRTDLINLRKKFGDNLEILMLSCAPENTAKYHKERSVQDLDTLSLVHNQPVSNFFKILKALVVLLGTFLLRFNIHIRLWPDCRRVLLEINSADLIFNVGGGNLNSFIPQELSKKGFTYIIAWLLKKPVVISGQTMGPYEGIRDRMFARFTLNLVKFISFRDKTISLDRLKELGVSKPILKPAADDAMSLPFISEPKTKQALSKEFDLQRLQNSKLVFGVNLKGSLAQLGKKGGGFDVSQLTDIMAKTADKVIEKYNGFALFIATDYHAYSDDRKLHDEIITKMKHKNKAHSLQTEFDDYHLKGIINFCDFVFGARYHYCVFAAGVHTPFLGAASGIYQMTKLRGLSQLLDLPECYFETDLLEANVTEFTKRVFKIIDNKKKISAVLKEKAPILSQDSLASIDYAYQLLTGK